jgi:stearoyl-CoA desaturase (delta-9 desaturase)
LVQHIGWFLNEQNFTTRKEVIKDWIKFPELVWLDRFSLPVVLFTALSIYGLGEWLAFAYPSLGTSGLQLLVWGFVVSTVLLIHELYVLTRLLTCMEVEILRLMTTVEITYFFDYYIG